MMYMQNVQAPQIGEWDQYGMDAAIYSSDQSYWGFGMYRKEINTVRYVPSFVQTVNV